MATHAETGRSGYSYADLASFPEDNLRREIIDGELIVTAAPRTRHQRAVAHLVGELLAHGKDHGGEVLPAPTDVYLSDDNVVEPDVLFVRADHIDRVQDRYVKGAPDLVVEISSPSTRLELVRKLDLYARFGVPEYWYVDLEAERVEVYGLENGRYGAPRLAFPGERLETPVLEGLSISVDDALGARLAPPG
jgi:Uma2 family endonuclease